LKHLIIGCGSIGRRHLRNLQALGERDIHCLRRAPDLEFARVHQVNVITSPEAGLALQPDAVYVCTPTSLHLDGLKLAVAARAHVLMEKPFVPTRADLTIARSLLAGHERVFFIGYMLRYHAMLGQLRDIAASSTVGKIFSARFEFGSYLPNWHPEEDYRSSYAARVSMGGGVLNTISHELDLIQSFFGDPTEVYGIKKNFGRLGIEAEEVCEAAFGYPDKLVTCHLDYLQKDYDRTVRVIGESGTAAWDWATNRILVREQQKPAREILPQEKFDVNQLYVDELKDFLALARAGQARHALDAAHALRNTELLLAVHEAAATGCLIRI